MKGKKLMAMLLCLMLVLSMLPTETSKVKAAGETVYYVSASGQDTNPGTAEAPFLTIAKAVTELSGNTDSDNIVKVIGEYELTNADFAVQHNSNITIVGNDSNAKLNVTGSITMASGPFTFKNIVINYPNGSKTIFARGNEVIFGDGVTTAGSGGGWWSFQNMISTGGQSARSYSTAHKMTISAGDFYRLYVGESRLTTGVSCVTPGVDFTMNGGHVFQFILGGDGWDGMWGTNSYTDDVNLTFNGGSVGTTGVTLAKYGVNNSYFQGGTDFNGHALQIIMNNGKDIPLDPGLTAENVEACNGQLFVMKSAAQEGSSLEATDVAGTFKVKGARKAIATDGENTYESQSGLLTVPAGTYSVTWEAPNTYYVSADGADTNIGTEESPFLTIEKAIKELSSNTGTNSTVKVIGEYTLTSADFGVQHSNHITIEGTDETAKLVVSSNVKAAGPLTLKNLELNYPNKSTMIYANGNELVLDTAITVTGVGGGWWSCQNLLSAAATYGTSYGKTLKLTINTGDFYRVDLGEQLQTGVTCTIPGVDFTMNGGSAMMILLGGNGWDGTWGTNKYTGNVNLTINDGSSQQGIKLPKYCDYFAGGTDFDGNAVQIIMNNGTNLSLDAGLTAENVEACNGHLYVLKCAAQSGSSLEMTDVAGTYKVNGDITAVATDGTHTYKSENGTLTVPKGTYTVDWKDEAVTVDGVVVDVVDGTYTLPTDAKYGYFCDGKMYKAGAKVTVTSSMEFTSVNELSLTMVNKAGIRYLDADGNAATNGGIRFQSTITSDNMDAVDSAAITEGTLITAVDIYESKGQDLTLTSDYTKIDVKNSGWYDSDKDGVKNIGTYCGSICDVIESNYIRHFTARAYVTVTYVDGEAVTVYSNMGPDRTISGVAAAVKAAGYPGVAEAYYSVIDSFIKE